MTPLRFGANYTPSGDWFFEWLRPDEDRMRADLAGLAALGLDHVRILPLWPVLQPNPGLIRPQALTDVRRSVELAAEAGLDASVDVLQGHLSSFDLLPSWLTSWHQTNLFTDPAAVAAQVRLVAALDETLADLPGFLGLTLGNEVNQFTARVHPSPMPVSADDVTTWLEALHGARRTDPGTFRVNAEYDAVWYDDHHPFLPTHSARHGDLTAIHSWVFNGTAQRYGAMSEHGLRHAEYLVELSRAFALRPDRPVWLQEVGAPLNHLGVAEAPDFLAETVRHAADSEALWGVTWWCSHDISRRLHGFPELEYGLGLLDAEGRAKPIGRRLAEVAAELRGRARPPARREQAVVVPVDDQDVPLARGELGPGGGVFETWVELAGQGRRPRLVTSRAAEDPAALAGLGVSALHHAPVSGRAAYSAVSDPGALPLPSRA